MIIKTKKETEMKTKYISLLILMLLVFQTGVLNSQEPVKDIRDYTREEVLNIPYEDLIEMPLEDLMVLADIMGVSLEELYEMILNKDVVSASKKVESSFVSPLSTTVISNDEIKASGAVTVEEALRLVPGLIVREKTNGNFDVQIRGNDNLPPKHMFLYSENSITLVMIDNRPVYNYVHGGTFWETLPIDICDIDRIEVVRGPSSALYGPNAVSGVVNIITKKQTEKKLKMDVDVQGGMNSTAEAKFSAGAGIAKNLTFRITGNAQTMDRNTEKLYVHKANSGQGGFITKEELATLTDPANTTYYVFDPHDDVDKMFPDPELSRQRYGSNAYLYYTVNDEINAELKGGYQSSEVISSTMGDNPMSMAGRVSKTGYADFITNIKGLHFQVNFLNGWQDIVREDTGFKVDIYNFNSNLEYDFIIGNLTLRPGISYQQAAYDDTPYLHEIGQGFLNKEREFTTMAYSLRADYLMLEKLRLIAAVRAEKYSTNNDYYLSYQAIVSYNMNEKHNFRFVSSRANRSPFLVDSYANYLWVRDGRPSPGYVLFQGQENLDLLTMDMFEFGYRVKPIKPLQIDVEAFYTKAENYGALYPDSVNLNGAQISADRPWVRMKFSNIDLISKEMGITASISWVAKENLVLKLFGTYQISKLENVIPYTQDETIQLMLEEAYFTYQNDGSTTYSTNFPRKRDDYNNKATPTVFGGFIADYSPIEKLKVNINTYFYTSQEFESKYGTVKIDPKAIVNLKTSYLLVKNLNVYLNVRNMISNKIEFGYMDEIGTTILAGINYNF